MKQLTYTYNNIMYYTWDSCKKNFPTTVFPSEENLTNELLDMFKIKRGVIEIPDNLSIINNKKKDIRQIRNDMLKDSDKYLMRDFPIEQVLLDSVMSWRNYLREYTKGDKWWEQEPLSFDEWLENSSKDLYE